MRFHVEALSALAGEVTVPSMSAAELATALAIPPTKGRLRRTLQAVLPQVTGVEARVGRALDVRVHVRSTRARSTRG